MSDPVYPRRLFIVCSTEAGNLHYALQSDTSNCGRTMLSRLDAMA